MSISSLRTMRGILSLCSRTESLELRTERVSGKLQVASCKMLPRTQSGPPSFPFSPPLQLSTCHLQLPLSLRRVLLPSPTSRERTITLLRGLPPDRRSISSHSRVSSSRVDRRGRSSMQRVETSSCRERVFPEYLLLRRWYTPPELFHQTIPNVSCSPQESLLPTPVLSSRVTPIFETSSTTYPIPVLSLRSEETS